MMYNVSGTARIHLAYKFFVTLPTLKKKTFWRNHRGMALLQSGLNSFFLLVFSGMEIFDRWYFLLHSVWHIAKKNLQFGGLF